MPHGRYDEENYITEKRWEARISSLKLRPEVGTGSFRFLTAVIGTVLHGLKCRGESEDLVTVQNKTTLATVLEVIRLRGN